MEPPDFDPIDPHARKLSLRRQFDNRKCPTPPPAAAQPMPDKATMAFMEYAAYECNCEHEDPAAHSPGVQSMPMPKVQCPNAAL